MKAPSVSQIDAWAQLNSIPGQFTGSTGVQVLTQEQLANTGAQAWIKKVYNICTYIKYLSTKSKVFRKCFIKKMHDKASDSNQSFIVNLLCVYSRMDIEDGQDHGKCINMAQEPLVSCGYFFFLIAVAVFGGGGFI